MVGLYGLATSGFKGNLMEKRPKLLIIGHARHGKDTVAEILRDLYGLTFESSSHYVGQKAVWPFWGQERYETFDQMFADRVNYRETWSNLIKAYNTPDLTRTGRGMIVEDGLDMYVGMRDSEEFQACQEEGLFTHVIWVDALERHPPENNPKMTMTREMADIIIDNNGSLADLEQKVADLAENLRKQGYNWRIPVPESLPKVDEVVEIDMNVIPDDAVHVLDHGYVAVAKVHGTDADIAEAARLSYGRGTKKVNKDEALIRYLYMNAHTSPFEMVGIKFQMRLPIFVMRQLIRHRTAHVNEYSGRYSVMPRLFYVPETTEIKGQSTTNKQGSDGSLKQVVAQGVQEQIRSMSDAAFNLYEHFLELGVSREMARIVLPLNTYTEVMWHMDLNNLLKFLVLRDDSHAQPEIQAFARIISDAVAEHFPMTFAAYQRRRNSVTLTREQLYALITGVRKDLPKGERAQVEELQRQLQQDLTKAMSEDTDEGPIKLEP